MSFLADKCRFEDFESGSHFSCGDSDLDDFFSTDVENYRKELLGKTYCFREHRSKKIVGAFTLSNDSIKTVSLPNNRKRKVSVNIPQAKRMKSYPAVLIGRLGIAEEFANCGVGCEILDFIKAWFIAPQNKTGCRFLVVDAYNNANVLNFYKKNGFSHIFSTEEQELAYFGEEKSCKTRLMYFDLIKLK